MTLARGVKNEVNRNLSISTEVEKSILDLSPSLGMTG